MRRSVFSVAIVVIATLVVSLFASSPATQAQALARVNILHLAPFAASIDDTAVTVVVNGDTIASDFKYKDEPLTASLPPGEYEVEIFVGDDLEAPAAISATVTLEAGVDYTVFAGGDGVNIPLGLFPLVDDNTLPEAPNASVRVVHAAPFAAQDDTGVDVLSPLLDDPLLEDFKFGDFSPYVPLPGNTPIPVTVVPTGAVSPVIIEGTLNVPPQTVTTVFAIGTGSETYPAELFFLSGTPRDLAGVRIAHLAPFAPGRAEVNIVVPGEPPFPLVTGFGFGDTTDYVFLSEGTYPIEVIIPGSNATLADTVAITGSVTIEPGKLYTAIAIGGANEFDPELVLLEDPTMPPAEGKARVRVYHAAPFAEDLDDTRVSIRTKDGTVVGGLDSVPYRGTATLEIDPGFYDLVIATPDGETVLINIPPFALEAGDDLTIFAVGDDENQNLGIVFLGTQSTVRLYLPIVAR